MSSHPQTEQRSSTLRQRAEAFLQHAGQELGAMPVQDVQRLVHELQVYQIELEMQNEALRQTQQELEASRDRYSSLYDFAPLGYLTLDHDGGILDANLTAARMLGVDRSQLRHTRFTDWILPDSQDTFYLHHQQMVTTQTMQTCTLHMQRQDGTAFFCRIDSLMVSEGAGNLPQWRTTLSDITVQQQLQSQLREAHKMEAVGVLAGGIAHDFNNILTAIIGFTELAQYKVLPASPVWQYLQTVLTAGQRAKALVQQILTFSRHTAPQRQPLRLSPLVEETLRLLRATLPSSIVLQTSSTATSDTVLADVTQLQQVLMNLGVNAAQAMQGTGGVLEVRLEEVEITAMNASAYPPLAYGPYMLLSVQDEGVGMSPEVMAHIFEPFYTTKGPQAGTGMGLAVVHGIISNHEGVITVASTPGRGTTFALYLPRITATAPVQASAEAALVQGTGRILFVDDEAILAELWQTMLPRLGYTVTAYTNPLDALAAFEAAPQSFDLVITDQTMPDMLGEALIHALRSIRPDIPVILCTGYSPLLGAAPLATLEVDAFLMKPVEIATFAHTIQHVLEARRTRPG